MYAERISWTNWIYEAADFCHTCLQAWSMLTLIILLNILIALFNSAYENVAGDAMAQYMAFFAQSKFF